MDTLRSDIRYAVRSFRKHPGLTSVAVMSLALGIGPNSAIFSLVDALGFRPLAVPDSANLLLVSSATEHDALGECSYPEYADIRQEAASFADVAASASQGVGIDGGNQEPGLALGQMVSDNYFAVMGVQPSIGRAVATDDDRPDSPPVVLISDRLWARRFNRDPNIVGRSVLLNRVEFRVIGVVPASFNGTLQIAVVGMDFYVPFSHARTLMHSASAALVEARGSRRLTVLARLRPGVTLEQARDRLAALGRRLEETYPETTQGRRLTVEYEERVRRGPLSMVAVVSLAVVGLVLLIACANVAGLLLGRSEARRAEMAVRLAMGASRGRLMRQLLTESALLSLVGASIGLMFAWWFMLWLPTLVPPGPLSLTIEPRLDVRVLLFTVAVAAVAVPLFGLTPAMMAARRDVSPVLKGESANAGSGRLRMRSVLVVGQVAVSLTLLIVSGLLVRSYVKMRLIDSGLVRRPMVFATLAPPAIGYSNAQTQRFFTELVERLEARPGVERASLTRRVPLNMLYGTGRPENVAIAGHEPPAGQSGFPVYTNSVSVGFFDTTGLRLLKGRSFSTADRAGTPLVAIINQTFARTFWPRADPIGHHIRLLPQKPGEAVRSCEVVGVVRDAKYLTLTEAPRPYLYLPSEQAPASEMTVIARGATAQIVSNALREEITALDRSMPITQLTSMEEHLRMASIVEQVVASVVTIVGAVALFLSVIGLYGVVAFAVARRTREIGIRVALGARPQDVVRTVLATSARLFGGGIAIGLIFAAVAGQTIRASLYGVSGADPLVFCGVTLLVVAVGLGASYLPARRAARIDPLSALRCE